MQESGAEAQDQPNTYTEEGNKKGFFWVFFVGGGGGGGGGGKGGKSGRRRMESRRPELKIGVRNQCICHK